MTTNYHSKLNSIGVLHAEKKTEAVFFSSKCLKWHYQRPPCVHFIYHNFSFKHKDETNNRAAGVLIHFK